MHNYSIMALDTEHLEEICQDIKEQYETGVTSCALFMMKLVPEGNPPAYKAAVMCEKYRLFQGKLRSMGIPNGVLVQATIGHGWILGEMFLIKDIPVWLVEKKKMLYVRMMKDFENTYIRHCEPLHYVHRTIS